MTLSINIPVPRCKLCKTELKSEKEYKTITCVGCMKEATTIAAYKERVNGTSSLLAEFARTTKKIDAPHVSELCEGMVQKFGGLNQLCNEWYQQIQYACQNNPGGKLALDGFSAMAKLIAASTEHRQSAPDIENLSEEDIDRELKALAEQMLRETQRVIDVA